MKKNNYKIIALTAAITLLLNGCASIKDASTAMGSTGTGVIAGVAAGAGTGIACDKLTGGKNTAACAAAGVLVGSLVGKLAADLDESAEKSVPAMDCKSVKRRMNYSSTATTPKALLKVTQPEKALKLNEPLKLAVKMDLVTPGQEGKEQPITFKIETLADGEKNTGKAITKDCGGDYDLPLNISTEKEGTFNTTLKIVDANTGTEIEGGVVQFCYTVAKDGVNKCGANSSKSNSSSNNTNPTNNFATSKSKKLKKK